MVIFLAVARQLKPKNKSEVARPLMNFVVKKLNFIWKNFGLDIELFRDSC